MAELPVCWVILGTVAALVEYNIMVTIKGSKINLRHCGFVMAQAGFNI